MRHVQVPHMNTRDEFPLGMLGQCFSGWVWQVKLHYTDGALRRIAQKAMVKNTGARGLRSIMETLLTDAMYQVCPPCCFCHLSASVLSFSPLPAVQIELKFCHKCLIPLVWFW